MFFIGDVHGHFNLYQLVLDQIGEGAKSIQVGDFGVGFKPVPELPPEAKFIRGNHDAPDLCRQHPNYLGDFGVHEEIFYAGGGYSIDAFARKEGVSWWRDEQLNYKQMAEATTLYADTKPEVVVTHQCPQSVEDRIFDFPHRYDNATSKWLDVLFELHKPKLWVFGHYHLSRNKKVNKTRFVCVRPCEVFGG